MELYTLRETSSTWKSSHVTDQHCRHTPLQKSLAVSRTLTQEISSNSELRKTLHRCRRSSHTAVGSSIATEEVHTRLSAPPNSRFPALCVELHTLRGHSSLVKRVPFLHYYLAFCAILCTFRPCDTAKQLPVTSPKYLSLCTTFCAFREDSLLPLSLIHI